MPMMLTKHKGTVSRILLEKLRSNCPPYTQLKDVHEYNYAIS